METYFEHFVLAGGWTMLLLLPGSIAAIALFARGLLMLRRSEILESESSIARRIRGVASIGEPEASVEQAKRDEVTDLFARIQPLYVLCVLAPMIGLLGSILAIMSVNFDAAAGASPEFVAAGIERALVPSLWGVGICAFSYAAFAILRARLYWVERRLLSLPNLTATDKFATGNRQSATDLHGPSGFRERKSAVIETHDIPGSSE